MTIQKENRLSLLQWLVAALAALLTITVCILPMKALPLWNGQIPGHRNQYEQRQMK